MTNVDIAPLAIDRAEELFGAEHVNVQMQSGSRANAAAMFALLDSHLGDITRHDLAGRSPILTMHPLYPTVDRQG